MSRDDTDAGIDALNFGIEKSMRYHQRRRGHYEQIHKTIMFLTVVSGSAAFAEILGWSAYFGAAAAALAAVDLVWAPSHRARDHEVLLKRFSDLAIEVRTAAARDAERYAAWVKKRLAIEADEPPVYWALEADCDNEVRRAWGRTKELVRIDWFSQITMDWHRHSRSIYRTAAGNGPGSTSRSEADAAGSGDIQPTTS